MSVWAHKALHRPHFKWTKVNSYFKLANLSNQKRNLARNSKLRILCSLWIKVQCPHLHVPSHYSRMSWPERKSGSILHWASKETYNFLEWCPLKSTASKWMIFGLMLATVLLITHVKKQTNRMCQKWDKCLQITTSPISKSQKLLLSTAQTFGHFNIYSFKFNSGIRSQ